MEVERIEIIPVREDNGLVAFASAVINNEIYLSGISIRTDLTNGGYRILFPTKKLRNNTQVPIYYPIDKIANESFKRQIIAAYLKLMNFKNVKPGEMYERPSHRNSQTIH